MKKFISLFLTVVMAITCFSSIMITATASDFSTVQVSGTYNYDMANQVLDLVNQERTAQGLSTLAMDSELLDCAMIKVSECSISFSHTRPNGTKSFSICSKMNGENIAAYQKNAQSVMVSWMNSQGHKDNILKDDYKSIGIGCFIADDGAYYWVQCFSSQQVDNVANKTGTLQVTNTISLTSELKKASLKKLIKGKKSIKITWKKVLSVAGYQVQYVINKKFTKNKKSVTIKKNSTTSLTVKGLKSKKTYYVRVRTYNTVNGKKVYSNWSTVKRVTTK
ncbi:MAG: CAP domain-containing protein, partial [Clostridiales bacterium]|nr:CAP domain-containing protein [Clostridiales bacterium]